MGRCVVAGWSPGVYLFTGADGPGLGEEPGGRSSWRPASCPASASTPKTNPAEEAVRLPEEETAEARMQRSRGQAGERRGTPSAGRAGGWARTDTHRGGTAPAKGLGQIFKSFLEQEGLTGPERVVLARGDLGDRPSGTSGPAPCSSDPLLASLPTGGHEEIRDEPRGWGHRPNAPDSPVRPWTEEPGGLRSMGSQRVRYN